MRNPLHKRLPREFFGQLGKYLAMFIFMTITIGFISGFLVAAGSMIQAYDESFEKYNIENGHFVLKQEADEELISTIEEEKVTIYSDYYVEEEIDYNADEENDGTLRIYGERKAINKVCLLEGTMPNGEKDIALDRMFAKNNKIEVGDDIYLAKQKYHVTGYIALPDYSALYEDNNDMMFDAERFGVAVVTEEAFQNFGKANLAYCYAWKYDQNPETEEKEKEAAEDLAELIAQHAEMENFLPEYLNKAIHFAGDDMGKDKPMMTVLLYILIIVLAFVFSVMINHTIVREANVIGTLRASGYTKKEIFVHYLTVPMMITFLSALFGNGLGYTIFKDIATDMYLGSYSLVSFETIWNAEAFIKTTVVPTMIMLIITSISLARKLAYSPLQFIRRDLTKDKRKKAVKLPKFKFFTRFRIRIILQNGSSYLTLFAGILFANLILLFGMMMVPLLENYKEDAIAYMPAEYQYILKMPVEVSSNQAEHYAITSLKMQDDYYDEEEISIYGLVEDSQYIHCKMPDTGVVITSDLAEKYKLEEGDVITLKEDYEQKFHAFEVAEIMEYPTSLAMFMPEDKFNLEFEKEEGYFNAYFSNKELDELEEEVIATCITQEDLTKLSRQMDISMGDMFSMVNVFAVVLFAILMYILTKVILEKNTNAISMIKILGYENGEIGRLYLIASVWVVVISLVVSMVINTCLMKYVFIILMKGFGGWFHFVIASETYIKMFLMGIGTYLVVALVQLWKIGKIPMEEALKNVE